MKVSLLTGGMDAHYAFGLLSGLISKPILIDVIGNNDMEKSDIMHNEKITHHNLRGDQNPKAPILKKSARVLRYYFKLVKYTATTDSTLFHILWLNKFIYFDRTILNLYYKFMGKKLVYTAHNVNAGERDGEDSLLNRLTLGFFYRTVDHIFVHTEKMKNQLKCEFGVPEHKVTVIPFGINNVIPRSHLSREEAREKLHLQRNERIILFFGNIAPYKGLDVLLAALVHLKKNGNVPKLIIAGKVKDRNWIGYWEEIESIIKKNDLNIEVLKKVEYIPDEEVEIYFKASDVLILPYRHIFQSGVLFLAYSFGLPVIAADVGSLKEEIVEGKTGFVCRREAPEDLADKINQFFNSELYKNLESYRSEIEEYANEKYSWQSIGETTCAVYSRL